MMRRIVYKSKGLLGDITVSLIVCLVIVSNQFVLVRVVGNGQRNIEFKLLADWYRDNVEPGQKLVTTMPGLVSIFVPERENLLVHTGNIDAESAEDFVRKCYDNNITYIAWDSRLGLYPNDRYYKLWGLKNIAQLSQPARIGPYEFVSQVVANERKYVNIFRLRNPK
ncbi:hypothetical protein ACFL3G_12485 [Planctomycetota bacterium]